MGPGFNRRLDNDLFINLGMQARGNRLTTRPGTAASGLAEPSIRTAVPLRIGRHRVQLRRASIGR